LMEGKFQVDRCLRLEGIQQAGTQLEAGSPQAGTGLKAGIVRYSSRR